VKVQNAAIDGIGAAPSGYYFGFEGSTMTSFLDVLIAGG
jgi:hypothetical protein